MSSKRPVKVALREVAPRDGLQDEKIQVSVAEKVRFIELLAASGVPLIEATSFVHPKRIPQLADAEDVFTGVRALETPDLRLLTLVPNIRGYDRARAVGVKAIALFTAASEGFNKKNINASIEESLERFRPICERAKEDGVWIRGYVSTAFGCPYEGTVLPENVARVVEAMLPFGCDEIALGDTIGTATPESTAEVVEAVSNVLDLSDLALHMHDVLGRAVANIEVGWEMGVANFDAATAGLGGCPYAPGAPGNVSMTRVVALFDRLGVETGVSKERITEAQGFIATVLNKSG
jgi:hydroxymethylglutaryl-CoA lyase